MILPAVTKVYLVEARTDRRIAALRCIEAVRLYAASHGGALPASMAEITEVPVPLDPVTGKSFEYAASETKATLTGPPPAGQQASILNALYYELNIGK